MAKSMSETMDGGGDTFAKGIVGKPSETDSLRKGGNQGGMGEKTLVYAGGYFRKESAGLEDGVSLRETINPSDAEPEYNYAVDSMTGNSPERKVGRVNNSSVKGKSGSFEIGEM